MALGRASLLRQVVVQGPATLKRLLWLQWELEGDKSWLGAVFGDLRHAALYVPAARVLLQQTCPLSSLVEAVRDRPSWWTQQLKKACKDWASDLQRWAHGGASSGPQPAPASPVPLPFTCSHCGKGFSLRKHLWVHLSRSHAVITPTRSLAWTSTCQACLKHYANVERLQYHLKSSSPCLLRTAWLVPPMTPEQLCEAERPHKAATKAVRGGMWEGFTATASVQQAYGPRALTAHEIVEAMGEELCLDVLARLFHPDPTFISFVEAYVADRSSEGQRKTASRFWDHRPSFTHA